MPSTKRFMDMAAVVAVGVMDMAALADPVAPEDLRLLHQQISSRYTSAIAEDSPPTANGLSSALNSSSSNHRKPFPNREITPPPPAARAELPAQKSERPS